MKHLTSLIGAALVLAVTASGARAEGFGITEWSARGMALAGGISRLTESVYETRFFGYCTELESMGADIQVNDKTAIVTGREKLYGTTVSAHDLRAGAALVIAGLAAEGVTRVENIHYVERGYENLIEKMTALGAQIQRLED